MGEGGGPISACAAACGSVKSHWQSLKKEKGNFNFFKVGRTSSPQFSAVAGCAPPGPPTKLCGTFSHMEGGEALRAQKAATVASAVANSSALYRLLSLTDEAFEADPEKDAKWYDVLKIPRPDANRSMISSVARAPLRAQPAGQEVQVRVGH